MTTFSHDQKRGKAAIVVAKDCHTFLAMTENSIPFWECGGTQQQIRLHVQGVSNFDYFDSKWGIF